MVDFITYVACLGVALCAVVLGMCVCLAIMRASTETRDWHRNRGSK